MKCLFHDCGQEVIYRKVLEDDGNRQVVEVEQLGRWKFLFLSGTFPTRVMIEQKRQEKTVLFTHTMKQLTFAVRFFSPKAQGFID